MRKRNLTTKLGLSLLLCFFCVLPAISLNAPSKLFFIRLAPAFETVELFCTDRWDDQVSMYIPKHLVPANPKNYTIDVTWPDGQIMPTSHTTLIVTDLRKRVYILRNGDRKNVSINKKHNSYFQLVDYRFGLGMYSRSRT